MFRRYVEISEDIYDISEILVIAGVSCSAFVTVVFIRKE